MFGNIIGFFYYFSTESQSLEDPYPFKDLVTYDPDYEESACELRLVWRINVSKYAFMIDLLSSLYSFKEIKREEMCNQYEAHEVYFYYAYNKIHLH